MTHTQDIESKTIFLTAVLCWDFACQKLLCNPHLLIKVVLIQLPEAWLWSDARDAVAHAELQRDRGERHLMNIT